ncbi:MAG: hypothetical protein GQ564_23690 [Bacteroidales bacterium]|nr:hypothetical protein [Bacteroidales bacterium]
MEPISIFLSTALGYILKSAWQTKAAKTAKEELVGGFWKWIRPKFIKDIPKIETNTEDEDIATKTEEKLLELIKSEDFFTELSKRVEELQKAGIKEKNIFSGNIKRMKKIRIGDKEYNANDIYTRKNIFEGDVEDGEEFILGDG